MKIGILGGTGREGTALALRWAASGEEVLIGSRDAQRARGAADRINRAVGRSLVRGTTNRRAAEEADVVVLTIPHPAQLALLAQIKDAVQGKLLIDTTVRLDADTRRPAAPDLCRSALEQAQELLGPGVQVVAAFQNISFRLLADPDRAIDCDVLVCGGDPRARHEAIALVAKAGLRGLDAGPARHAKTVEGLTLLLLELNRRYRSKEAGIRITGLPEGER